VAPPDDEIWLRGDRALNRGNGVSGIGLKLTKSLLVDISHRSGGIGDGMVPCVDNLHLSILSSGGSATNSAVFTPAPYLGAVRAVTRLLKRNHVAAPPHLVAMIVAEKAA